jgi:hypothetical protein
MLNEKPTTKQKRQYYVITFCFALGIDFLTSWMRGIPYHPTLLGMAIMIAAVLYFAVSLFRDR